MTPGRGRLAALIGVAVLAAAAVVVLLAISAGLTVEANAYYSGFDYSEPVDIDPVKDAYYNGISQLSSALWVLAGNLLLIAIGAAFTTISVLGVRWDARKATGQVDATAAS
jgi:hypothetical protein